MVAVVVVLLLAIGGGGYWFMSQDPTDIVATTELSDPDELEVDIEQEIVVDDEEPDGEIDQGPKVITPSTEPPAIVEAAPVARGEKIADKLKSSASGPEMLWVPGGKFTMGGRESAADFDERPQHTVSVKPFAMSVNEITIAEYRQFAKSTGRKMPQTGD